LNYVLAVMLDLIKDSDMELRVDPNTYGGVDRIIF